MTRLAMYGREHILLFGYSRLYGREVHVYLQLAYKIWSSLVIASIFLSSPLNLARVPP